ncbi:hypothetical protein N0V87_005505 [Didymella glomerata]|uniref:DNA-binding protein RAP1 n=1 Tax=Didymella glomerata TaxID=749621 RepID=A0A9W8WYE5_9PLEO|nr:hypothetical protein N0V87_005505 [Didymella glomerata]
MASAVVYDDVAEGADVATGALFDGYKFWVAQRVPIRASYLAKIEANGGQVVKLEKQADFLIADHFRRECPSGTISYEFIDKSIAQGRVLDPDDFPAGPRVGTARDVGSIVRPAKGTRAAYTPEEDRQLYKWVRDAQANGVAVSGNELYKQLEKKNPRHTWQSWRDRYLKKLQYMPPSAFNIPNNAPPSPPSDQSSRAADVPVVRSDLVKNKDRARPDAAGESASMGTATSKEQAASEVRDAPTEDTTEEPVVKRTGLVKNKDKTRTTAASRETITGESISSRVTSVSAPQATAEDTSRKEVYNVTQLAATFSTEDWEELYAFVEHIDNFAHDKLSYETSWTNWAENKDNQTPEQWRQYYEKVVRPQWLQDPESKRERIRRKVEERHMNDSSSPTKSQSWSQTQEAVAASQKDTAASQEVDEAPSEPPHPPQRTVSNTLPSDSRLESEATAQQETPQCIRNGYESALKRIRGDQDAAPVSTDAARPAKIRRKYSLPSSPENSAASGVNGTQEQPLEVSSRVSSQQEEGEQSAPDEVVRSPTQCPTSHIIDLGDEAASEASEEDADISLFPPGYVEWMQLRDAAIAAGAPIPRPHMSATDYRRWKSKRLAAVAPWEQSSQGIDFGDGFDDGSGDGLGDEASSEASEGDLEALAPIPHPHVFRQDSEDIEEDIEEDIDDAESVASSTDLTHIAPLLRPPQIPEASDDDEEDSLPSNTPTPRAPKFAAFDTQAILSPSQNVPFVSRLPRPIDSSPPHHPDSEASTTQSLQEFSSYLQDTGEDSRPQPQTPIPRPPRPASPTPSATSEAESVGSHASTGSGDPDPPLQADEMDAFFSEQLADGFSNEHVTKALKRTRFRPGLATTVLEAWRHGNTLPDQRGVWSVEEDETVESGDGAALAQLGRKHTVDGWGGVTERMNFLQAWERR